MKKSIIQRKVAALPQNPGVYFFCDQKGQIIYIGKATNLKSRVSSYFRDLTDANLPASSADGRMDTNLRINGRPIEALIHQVADIRVEETDSVLEALILESNLIKKYQPKYNIKEKDDKSFAYFVITKEEFPRVLIVRGTDLEKADANLRINANLRIGAKKIENTKYNIRPTKAFGPYTSKQQMQTALKIMRRIFPIHLNAQKTEKGCLDFQLGLCSGPYVNAISKVDYQKNIRGIRMILEGKKKSLVKTLEKEMQIAAKAEEFEKATELRNKIFALNHIRDVALMTRDLENQQLVTSHQSPGTGYELLVTGMRIEAYDISNISGEQAVGSMVVFSANGGSAYGGENWQPNKSQYRKFKIKTVTGANDVAMMKEVLLRRFKNDWPMPDLILLDGGVGHANMMGDLARRLGLDVLVVAVAKGKTRKNLNFQFPISNKFLISQFPKELLEFLNDKDKVKNIMDEAHRFAITYHRKLRRQATLK